MTEEEWMACVDPARIIEQLAGDVSYRKLRLCACAACRQAGDSLTGEWSQKAVKAAEQTAEGDLEIWELETLHFETGQESGADAKANPAWWASAPHAAYPHRCLFRCLLAVRNRMTS
jgi:hypothetical protein